MKSLVIGFILNPIAGLGGKKAWKGTDLIEQAWELFNSGDRYAFSRVQRAFSSLSEDLPISFLCCDGIMGKELLEQFPFQYSVVCTPPKTKTSSNDTKKAVKIMLEKNIDLLLFAGGDGTALDIVSVLGPSELPVLGIPTGVKMFSGCFLFNPEQLGTLISQFLNEDIYFASEDVLDVDESLFRKNQVQATLFGKLNVPQFTGLIQGGKVPTSKGSELDYESIAEEIQKEYKILEDLVILGPGSTVYEVMRVFGISKTLLGVDLLKNGKFVEKDLEEERLLELTKDKKVKLLLTPIGGQGFLLGRGNQQISSRVISGAKSLELIVVSTESKLDSIESLHVDMDEDVSTQLFPKPFVKVCHGNRLYKMKRVNLIP